MVIDLSIGVVWHLRTHQSNMINSESASFASLVGHIHRSILRLHLVRATTLMGAVSDVDGQAYAAFPGQSDSSATTTVQVSTRSPLFSRAYNVLPAIQCDVVLA